MGIPGGETSWTKMCSKWDGKRFVDFYHTPGIWKTHAAPLNQSNPESWAISFSPGKPWWCLRGNIPACWPKGRLHMFSLSVWCILEVAGLGQDTHRTFRPHILGREWITNTTCITFPKSLRQRQRRGWMVSLRFSTLHFVQKLGNIAHYALFSFHLLPFLKVGFVINNTSSSCLLLNSISPSY